MSYSGPELAQLAQAAGFSKSQARTMAAIALAESGGDPSAVGDRNLTNATWGPSIGLWQVRSLNAQYGTGRERDASRLTDPAFNAHAARVIFGQQGYHAWSTYNSGAYGKHLDAVDGKSGGLGSSITGTAGKGLGSALMPGAALGSKVLGLPNIGGAVIDSATGALTGLDAVGAFFGSLTQHGTWVRVAQVLGGTALIVGGVVWLGKDIAPQAASVAADFIPAGRAAKAVGAVAGAAK